MILKQILVSLCLLLVAFSPSPAEKPAKSIVGKDSIQTDTSKQVQEVVSVVLYRGQAQITRQVSLPKGIGSQEIVVSNLPRAIISNSLFAEGNEGIEIQALRYRERYLDPEEFDDSEVKKLNEALEENKQALELNKHLQGLGEQHLGYLDSLEQFVAPSAQAELTNGVLDVEALKQLTLFSFEQRQTLITKQVELNQEQKDLEAKQQQLIAERNKLTNEKPTSQQMREAVIFLNKTQEEQGDLFLSYLVGSSGWQPAYNFRANSGSGKVAVEYNAIIQQLSGEDWNDVNLTLSTATPSLSASGPALGTFPITLTRASSEDIVSNIEQQVIQSNIPVPNKLLEQAETLAYVAIPNDSSLTHTVRMAATTGDTHSAAFKITNSSKQRQKYTVTKSLTSNGFEWLRVISYSGVVEGSSSDSVEFLAFCPEDPTAFFSNSFTTNGELIIAGKGFANQRVLVQLSCNPRASISIPVVPGPIGPVGPVGAPGPRGPVGPAGAPSPAPQDAYGNILNAQQSAQNLLEQATSLRETLNLSFTLNSAANAVSLLEMLAKNKSSQATVLPKAELSLNYDFKNKVSLASRRDQQIIRISKSTVEANFYYVATPVLTKLIYREAELKNTSDTDFLAGRVSTYLDDKFVGRTEIDAIARGQSFTLGFGADPQLRSSRRLVKRDEKVQGGNQLINLQYEIRLENFSEEGVKVRLLDRLPISDNSLSVKISLGEVSETLSKDAAYKRLEQPKGILRWDIKLLAEASGENAFALNYGYGLEFDRNYQLSTPDQTGEMQEEFENFQQERMMKH